MKTVSFFGHTASKLILGDNPMNGYSYIGHRIPGKEMVEYYTAEKFLETLFHAQELGYKTMLPLAVATSIDALAIGVTFAFLNVNIIPAVLLIGATTFVLSAGGLQVGNVFGTRYKSTAELVGGIILICLGGKILVEHIFFGG